MVNARWRLALALVLVGMLVVPSASATHMQNYRFKPTEHDDLGRVAEPDFASTGVLGVLVGNCVGDFTPADAGCVPDALLTQSPGKSPLIAPGCTDDSGSRPSGTCGLYTVGVGDGNAGSVVPAGVVGTQGMTGTAAPGRITPSKSTVVRFLDMQTQFQFVSPAGGAQYLEYNHKLTDSGARAAMASLDPNLGNRIILPAGTALWAWYGTWQDKNGNGVVDHLSIQDCDQGACPPEANGGVAPNNEFIWVGKCTQFEPGHLAPPGSTYCRNETGPNGAVMRFPVWVFPGNHHAYCGFAVDVTTAPLTCPVAPADFPGRQVFNTLLGGYTDIAGPDEDDGNFSGDALLGDQNSVAMDHEMGDRTGENELTGRHWVFGNGWATFFYDQSVAVSTVTVGGPTFATPDSSNRNTYALGSLLATDVDHYRSLNPALEDLLQNTLKPAARGTWTTFRNAYITGVDTLVNTYDGSRLTYDECDPNLNVNCPSSTNSARTFGRLLYQASNNIWAKEPNTAGDRFPAATRGACTATDNTGDSAAFRTYQGQCNSYALHANAWHAWMDVQSFNAIYTALAWSTPIGNCITCTVGPPSGMPDLGPGYVRGADEFSRVLSPGSHVFFGISGAWRDRAQAHREETLDVPRLLALDFSGGLTPKKYFNYTVQPDGWVGDIVNNTATPRTQGFTPETCTVAGVTAPRVWGACHPYMDGNIDASLSPFDVEAGPQDYGEDVGTGGEFDGGEPLGGTGWQVILTAQGCWSQPTFVWRAFDTWEMGDLGAIEDHTGKCTAITLPLGQGGDGGPGIEGANLLSRDLLILPNGNRGMPVTSTVSGVLTAIDVGKGLNVVESITDVDVYGPFGGA